MVSFTEPLSADSPGHTGGLFADLGAVFLLESRSFGSGRALGASIGSSGAASVFLRLTNEPMKPATTSNAPAIISKWGNCSFMAICIIARSIH